MNATTKQKVELKRGIRIRVADLKVGDRIVTRWHKPFDKNLTRQQQLQVELDGIEGVSYVAKSSEVKQRDLCEGQWRTHIHINKSDCYDERQYVWIVETKADREEG